MNEMGQVRIGREFFSKIKLDYNNWQWALVREFLQNCFDAPDSKQVSVRVEVDGGDTRLIVGNDGAPMSREVLVEKLLTLGGSGKNFEGENTGGFGVAKSLLYYCHKRYAIYTGALLVEGEGAQYSIRETGGETLGTVSNVLVEGDHAVELRQMVRRFASMAQWRGSLTLDGEVLATDLRKGARRRDLGWGIVYTNTSRENLCLVRLNGQPMFTTYCRHKGCVLVELVGKACEVLTSNRDGLKGKYASELSDLLTALAVDKRSALREQRAEYKRYQGERQRHEARQPRAADLGLTSVIAPQVLQAILSGPASKGTPAQVEVAPPTADGGGIKVVAVSREDEPDTAISIGPEFIVKNTTGMKVPAYYQPGEKFSDYARGLVQAWCGVLVKLHQVLNVSGEFSVGFVFDEESLAEAERTAAYGLVYYINPVRIAEEGKRRMEPRFTSGWSARHEVISTAAHEIVHGAYGYKQHDEDYASKLTDVMVVCLREMKDLEAVCKPVKDDANLPKTLHRQEVVGHPMTRVVMWMGARGWSFDVAWDTLSALGCQTTGASVRTFLRAGARGERGEPAQLTQEQVEQLEAVAETYR